ncbi:MAG: hypothetical protein ACJAX5_002612 [Patiriisocius sp.]|jgi:hypothetical protein
MNRFILLLIAICFTSLSYAGEADDLIQEVTTAYDGDTVTRMKTFRSHDRFLTSCYWSRSFASAAP